MQYDLIFRDEDGTSLKLQKEYETINEQHYYPEGFVQKGKWGSVVHLDEMFFRYIKEIFVIP